MNELVLRSRVDAFPLEIIRHDNNEWAGDEEVFATRSYMPLNFSRINVHVSPCRKRLQILASQNYSFLKVRANGLAEKALSVGFFTPPNLNEIRPKLKTKTICFVGMARDCADHLVANLELINTLGQFFKEFHVVIYENDSKDNTLTLLESSLAHHKTLKVFSIPGLSKQHPERTVRLALLRNMSAQYALELGADFFCPVDLDGILTTQGHAFSTEGFLSNFQYEDFWDGVFPVCEDFYYDIWALRQELLSPDDFHVATSAADSALGENIILAKGGFCRQFNLRAMPGWLAVDSAFGGMGIYKTSSIRESRYVGQQGQVPICEHVPFNLGLKSLGKRLYVNPSFIVKGDTSAGRNGVLISALGM